MVVFALGKKSERGNICRLLFCRQSVELSLNFLNRLEKQQQLEDELQREEQLLKVIFDYEKLPVHFFIRIKCEN